MILVSKLLCPLVTPSRFTRHEDRAGNKKLLLKLSYFTHKEYRASGRTDQRRAEEVNPSKQEGS